MKILLVFGSLFVFANAKGDHHGHNGQHKSHNDHNNHNNHNNGENAATPAVDFRQCFQALLLSFDFSAPASDAEAQVNAKCTVQVVQARSTFGHKNVLNKINETYQAMTADEKTQAKLNQTSNNTAGIIEFFRAKLGSMHINEKQFNKTIADIYQPLVSANLQTAIRALNLSKDLKKSLIKDLKEGKDMNAGIAFLKTQLAAATSLQPSDQATLTAFVNELSAISL